MPAAPEHRPSEELTQDKLSPAKLLGLLCPRPEDSRGGGGEGQGHSPEALGDTRSDMTTAVSESRHSGCCQRWRIRKKKKKKKKKHWLEKKPAGTSHFEDEGNNWVWDQQGANLHGEIKTSLALC